MAEAGVYYDPHTSLVIRNYLDNRERFLGIGNYTEEGFRQMEALLASMLPVFAQAPATGSLGLEAARSRDESQGGPCARRTKSYRLASLLAGAEGEEVAATAEGWT